MQCMRRSLWQGCEPGPQQLCAAQRSGQHCLQPCLVHAYAAVAVFLNAGITHFILQMCRPHLVYSSKMTHCYCMEQAPASRRPRPCYVLGGLQCAYASLQEMLQVVLKKLLTVWQAKHDQCGFTIMHDC
jgi:hypothetical protein